MSNIKAWSILRENISQPIRQIQEINNPGLVDLVKTIEVIQQESEMLRKEMNSLTQIDLDSPSVNTQYIPKRLDVILGFIEHIISGDVFALKNDAQIKLANLENNLLRLFELSKLAKKEIENTSVDSTDLTVVLESWSNGYWEDVPDWEDKPDGEFSSLFDKANEIAVTLQKEVIDEIDRPNETKNDQITQESLRQKIDAVRDKYVIGNVAGEDLLDSKGAIIIRKNETITKSSMEKALNEGKLAELIVNMVLPEQEE